MNKVTLATPLPSPIITPLYDAPSPGPFYTVGGGLQGEKGFTGCVGRVAVDGALTSDEDWWPAEVCTSNKYLHI